MGKNFLGKMHSTCKGPEMGRSSWCLRIYTASGHGTENLGVCVPQEGVPLVPRALGQRAHLESQSPRSHTSEYRSRCLRDAGQPRPALGPCGGCQLVGWGQQSLSWPGVRRLGPKLTHSVPRQALEWQTLRSVGFF